MIVVHDGSIYSDLIIISRSCVLCRRRKIKCNRENPCSNCVRSRTATCIYEKVESLKYRIGQSQQTAQNATYGPRESLPFDKESTTSGSAFPSNQSSSRIDGSVGSSTDATHTSQQHSTRDDESVRLKLRIKELEEQLSNATLAPVKSPVVPPRLNIETTTSHIGGTYHVHCERLPGQNESVARGVTHKSRLFGQSHWEVNVVLMVRLNITSSHYLRSKKMEQLTSVRSATSSRQSNRISLHRH